MTSLETRAATAKLGPWQSRRGVVRWAQLIEREAAATGEAPLQVMRAHLAAVDQKIGVVAGLAGFLGAVIAFVGPAILAAPREGAALAFLGVSTLATVLAANQAVEALGAAIRHEMTDADIETARLVSLARRAGDHAISLRYLQVAGAGLGMLAGTYVWEFTAA